MTIGGQPTEESINQQLQTLSVGMRGVMQGVVNLDMTVTALGTPGLITLGFSPTDAAAVVAAVNYMQNVAGCYFGTVQQGGTGGTGAILFNFNQELCPLWGGQ